LQKPQLEKKDRNSLRTKEMKVELEKEFQREKSTKNQQDNSNEMN